MKDEVSTTIIKISRNLPAIEEIDPSYHFYLRYYGSASLPTEYLLYGV